MQTISQEHHVVVYHKISKLSSQDELIKSAEGYESPV